ncbi:MAG: acyltransferase family protein [Methanobrevibacter sp.]|nr:acyltransferase family protein [Methanobrevibacter sp.]
MNGCFWQFSSTGRYWITANMIECVFYFAVPVFFMISGAMLIDFNKKYSLREYFTKRINKTLIPYIVWSFLGLAFQIWYLQSVLPSNVNITYILNGLLNGNLVNVYWFFIPLFCTYLTIPLFALIPTEKRKDIFTYIVVLGFIINVAVPFLNNVFNIGLSYSISLGVVSNLLFYTLVGYLLHNYEISKQKRYFLYLFAVIGLIMHFAGTYYASMAAGEISYLYKGYANLPAVLYSVGIFTFIKYDLNKIMGNLKVNNLVNFLRNYTFGIYLIHLYVLRIIVKVFSLNTKSIIYRISAPFLIFGVCVLIIHLLRKIPLMKKILP